MRAKDIVVTPVSVPTCSRLATFCESLDLADAYSVPLPEGCNEDPEVFARFVFAQKPSWVAGLMMLRDGLVSVFGLKTSRRLVASGNPYSTERIAIFRIYERRSNEVILGEDDKHLDFRLSVLFEPKTDAPASVPHLVLSTVVRCHNRLGRTYIAVIAPFHRMVVKSYLRRAARLGWPAAVVS
jgi:hypothetical protein